MLVLMGHYIYRYCHIPTWGLFARLLHDVKLMRFRLMLVWTESHGFSLVNRNNTDFD